VVSIGGGRARPGTVEEQRAAALGGRLGWRTSEAGFRWRASAAWLGGGAARGGSQWPAWLTPH
jgi:hypothetical protein